MAPLPLWPPAVRPLRSLALLGASLLALRLSAHVRPAPIFSDGVVLQRDRPVTIWGHADPAEKIAVRFHTREAHAQADARGDWQVTLPPLEATAIGSDLIVAGTDTAICHDVLVGDVWWCSGQSNMEFAVASALDAPHEIAAADFPAIREIKIARHLAEAPDEDFTATGWRAARPRDVGDFSAVGYFFARDLHRWLKVPIGIVNCTWSGTPIEPWMSAAALASDPRFAVVAERWRADLAAYPARRASYEQSLAAWRVAEAKAAGAGAEAHAAFLQAQRAPRPPIGAPDHPYPSNPSAIFNGMVFPLRRLSFAGTLWYQGEANAVRAPEYAALFQAHIREWRRVFARADLPFYWVQIASFEVETDWPRQRAAQASALALPHTGQAVTIDIGDPANLHPANKQEVGRRLALIAQAELYGRAVEYSGPTLRTAARDGATFRATFDHAAGLTLRAGGGRTLELAGADRVFHPAVGHIAGDALVVSTPEVPAPVALRYAWRSAPEAALFNAAGLPAAPFRTDAW
jgi:sialate O-acetylesterase